MTAKSRWTAGPWTVKPSKRSDNFCIYSAAVSDEIGGYGIGEAWNYNNSPENLANAHLIAAAPDLYEALKSIRDAWEDDAPVDHLIRASLAALTKANQGTQSPSSGES